jgi:acetaldehyde dehydrogenase
VPYAEIVASIASKSAGPGTRANIDEFTETTSRAISEVGGAEVGKAIIVLNPAEPPLLMRDTVMCEIGDGADPEAIAESIGQMAAEVATYVPGYRLTAPPQFRDGRVTILLEVEGAGDFLERYSGNLDIMTAAATRVGERIAEQLVAA